MASLRALAKEIATAPFKLMAPRQPYSVFTPWSIGLRPPPQMRVPRPQLRLARRAHRFRASDFVVDMVDEKIPALTSALFIVAALALNIVAITAFTTIPEESDGSRPASRQQHRQQQVLGGQTQSSKASISSLPLTIWNQ